jgi:hypothetical protein
MTHPLCGEEAFAADLAIMVSEEAPRLFAVVQELGMREDSRIAAWGMAFEDRVDVIGLGGDVHLGTREENLLRRFRIGTRVTPRLVWVS